MVSLVDLWSVIALFPSHTHLLLIGQTFWPRVCHSRTELQCYVPNTNIDKDKNILMSLSNKRSIVKILPMSSEIIFL